MLSTSLRRPHPAELIVEYRDRDVVLVRQHSCPRAKVTLHSKTLSDGPNNLRLWMSLALDLRAEEVLFTVVSQLRSPAPSLHPTTATAIASVRASATATTPTPPCIRMPPKSAMTASTTTATDLADGADAACATSCPDRDGDGYASSACGGTDCMTTPTRAFTPERTELGDGRGTTTATVCSMNPSTPTATLPSPVRASPPSFGGPPGKAARAATATAPTATIRALTPIRGRRQRRALWSNLCFWFGLRFSLHPCRSIGKVIDARYRRLAVKGFLAAPSPNQIS